MTDVGGARGSRAAAVAAGTPEVVGQVARELVKDREGAGAAGGSSKCSAIAPRAES